MNAKHLTVAGPFTYENLSIFLLRGSAALDGSRFIPLDEALEQKCVTVHETGTVGQLEVENLSDSLDLYIQAGDVVKGGRQDRTLGVDFVLPAKSGRVPIFEQKEVPPRVRVDTRRTENTYVFDTRDHAFNDAVLHKNLVAN